MHCVVNFEKININGSFSFEIVSSYHTSESVIQAITSGSAKIPNLVDGGPIFVDNEIIAKIVRCLPAYNFSESKLILEKNRKIPYFFGFEDQDEIMNHFNDADSFFPGKKVLLGAKHLEGDGYGTLFIVVKDEVTNKLYSLHIEDTIRGRNGPTKFFTDGFIEMTRHSIRDLLSVRYEFMNEYFEVFQEIVKPYI